MSPNRAADPQARKGLSAMTEPEPTKNNDQYPASTTHTEKSSTPGGIPDGPQDPINPNKRKRRLVVGITAGVAGLALAATAALGLGSHSQSQTNKTTKTTETTAPSNPIKSSEVAPAYKIVFIPIGATGDEIGKLIIDIENAQYDGNLTQATYDAILHDNSGASFDDLGKNIATANTTKIMNAQYKPGWNQDQNLSDIYTHVVYRNATRIHNYTSGQTLKENISFKSAQIISKHDTEIVINIISVDHYTNPNDPVNEANIDGGVSNEVYTLVPLANRLVISHQDLSVK
jgi:hypothetical protein